MSAKYILASSLENIEVPFDSKASKMFEWEPKIVVYPGAESLMITQLNPDALILFALGIKPSWDIG